ncbi:MAG: hypothetical protein AAF501_07315 [Pseudomonadota bacterium]
MTFGALLSACGVPPEERINAQQPGDAALACEAINTEKSNNDARIGDLTKAKALANAGNFGTSITNQSARSLSKPEQEEIDRLTARNAVLDDLGQQKGCG